MVDFQTKVPVKNEPNGMPPAQGRTWYPFENLRREVDRLFEDFDGDFWRAPMRRSLFEFAPFGRLQIAARAPAVDIAEKEMAYEITVELPGLDEKHVDVTYANGGLTIKGEKKEEKEEKRKNFYLSERRFGTFERYFAVPEGVDADKIAAGFKNGVLTVTLPKTVEAQKQEKKIAVKAS